MRRRPPPPPPPPGIVPEPRRTRDHDLPLGPPEGVRSALQALSRVAFVIGWMGAGLTGVVAARMMIVAFRMLDDDLLFFLGLIVFFPLAMLLLSFTVFLAGMAWRSAPDRILEGLALAAVGTAVALFVSVVFF